MLCAQFNYVVRTT